jgi:hypothetical protein
VAAAATLIGLILFAACYAGSSADKPISRTETLWWLGQMGLILGSLTLAVYVVPALIGLGLVAGTVILVVCEVADFATDLTIVALAYAVVVASFAVNAVAVPRPLPIARVTLTRGNAVLAAYNFGQRSLVTCCASE